jgi:NAD(P)-dependent dehydrogenase (short-subunit alcohol dehydrogenase family)
MTGLAEKVVIVTGAANGLGAAIARRFAEDGARLVLFDIQRDAGERLAAELGADFVAGDVTREDDIAAIVAHAQARHGRLDCMINNAGIIGTTAGMREVDMDGWESTMAVLLRSVMFGIKHASRIMVPQHDGVILSTTSVAGVGPFGPAVYSAAKHGVIGLTRAAAAEFAPHRVRVNAIAPGTVPTPLTSAVYGDADGVRQAAAARTPLGFAVEPEDIAEGFAYLAGRGGRAITGQVLVIDGGLTGCPIGSKAFGLSAPG